MPMMNLTPVYDELLDYLVSKATPDEILAFRPSPQAQARADELTERNKDETLTADERAELAQMMELDALISVLKAKALRAKQNA